MAHLLITGFGPFGPHDFNPTMALIQALAARGLDGHQLTTAILPVEYERCADMFFELVESARPDAAVAFGLAFSIDRIHVERVALNLDEAPYPDNAGVSRRGERILQDGPVGYWSGLPVERLVAALIQAGIPAGASNSAGGFICNHLFYRVRHRLESEGRQLPMGFVHVPPGPKQVVQIAGRSGMDPATLETGARLILAEVAALCTPEPAGVS